MANGNSPYVYNIPAPRGGANESSTPFGMEENPILDAFDTFQAAKDRRRKRAMEDAKMAQQIAELQGEYTPELEQIATAPLGREAGIGSQIAGGLGRLVGVDTDLGRTEPIQLSQPLQTKQQRELAAEERKTGRETEAALLKHEREMERLGYQADLDVGKQRTKVKEGLVSEPLTVEDRKSLARIKKAGTGRFGTNDPKKILQWRLLSGEIDPKDLSNTDYMILGNFYASMTPEQRSKDAMTAAQKLTQAAMDAGEMKDWKPDEIKAMQQQIAQDYLDTQDQLMGNIKGQTGGKKGGQRRPIGDIMIPGS